MKFVELLALCLLVLGVDATLLHQIASPSVGKKFGQMVAVQGNRLIAADDDTLWAYKWGFNKWDFTGLVGSGHLGEIKDIIMGDNTTAYIVYQQNVTHGAISLYSLVNEEWLGFGDLPVPDTNFGRAVTYYDGELAILGASALYKIDTNFTVTPSAMDACVDTIAKVSITEYLGGCEGEGITLDGGAADLTAPGDMVIQMEDYIGGLPGVLNGVVLSSTGGNISVALGAFGLAFALTSTTDLVNHTIYDGTGFFHGEGTDGSFTVVVGFMNENSTGGLQVLYFNGTDNEWSEMDKFDDQGQAASFYGMNADYSDLGLYVTTAHRAGANDGTIFTYSSGDYQLQTTDGPTVSPTVFPTDSPTTSPTATPTVSPTRSPTETEETPAPTDAPTTAAPTVTPTDAPTGTPTAAPSVTPSVAPSVTPSVTPTEEDPENLPVVIIVSLSVGGAVVASVLAYLCWGSRGIPVASESAATYDF